MSVRPKTNNAAYGLYNPIQELAPQPIIAKRNPTTADQSEIGTTWINTLTNEVFTFTSLQTWTEFTSNNSPNIIASGNILIQSATGEIHLQADGVSGEVLLDSTNVTAISTGNMLLTSNATATLNGQTSVSVFSPESASLGVAAGDSAATVSITNATGTSATSVSITSTVGGISMTSAANTVNSMLIGTTGGTTSTMLMTNTTGTSNSAVGISAPLGGIAINGATVSLSSNTIAGAIFVTGLHATVAGLTITNNSQIGVNNFTGQTIANNGTATLVLNNSNIASTKGINFSLTNLNVSTNGAYLQILGSIQGTGSLSIFVKNVSGAALATTDTIILTHQIIS